MPRLYPGACPSLPTPPLVPHHPQTWFSGLAHLQSRDTTAVQLKTILVEIIQGQQENTEKRVFVCPTDCFLYAFVFFLTTTICIAGRRHSYFFLLR